MITSLLRVQYCAMWSQVLLHAREFMILQVEERQGSLSVPFSHYLFLSHTHTHTHTHNDMMDKMLKYKVFGDASLRGGNDLLTFMNKLESLNSAVSNSILLTMLLPQFPKCTVSSITHSTSITTSHLTIPCSGNDLFYHEGCRLWRGKRR